MNASTSTSRRSIYLKGKGNMVVYRLIGRKGAISNQA
jgi:hypothetical protein